MKSYEFLEHTADIKVRAYGKTLEQAFINAAYALTNIVTKDKIKKIIEKTIKVESEDEKSLLYDFLEQFLILIDSEGFLLAEIKELKRLLIIEICVVIELISVVKAIEL